MTKKTEMSTPEPVGGDNRGEIVQNECRKIKLA